MTFYCSSIESILTYCISVWFSRCTEAEQRRLKGVVKIAPSIIAFPTLKHVYSHHQGHIAAHPPPLWPVALRQALQVHQNPDQQAESLTSYYPRTGKHYFSYSVQYSCTCGTYANYFSIDLHLYIVPYP